MKLSVTKEYTWDCAHMLSNHEGLCANVHGHTYKMQVEVMHIGSHDTSRLPATEGMVVDFKELKNIVKDRIVDKLDHAFITWNSGADVEKAVATVLKEHGLKIYIMDCRPTAENMSKHFFNILSRHFNGKPFAIRSVKVWETPTSFATYTV